MHTPPVQNIPLACTVQPAGTAPKTHWKPPFGCVWIASRHQHDSIFAVWCQTEKHFFSDPRSIFDPFDPAKTSRLGPGPPSPPYNAAPPAPLGAGGGEIAKNRYRFGSGNPGTQPRRPYIIIYIANGNPRVPTLRIGENLGSRYAMAPNQKSLGNSGRLLVGSQNRFLTQLEPPCESTLGVLSRP